MGTGARHLLCGNDSNNGGRRAGGLQHFSQAAVGLLVPHNNKQPLLLDTVLMSIASFLHLQISNQKVVFHGGDLNKQERLWV